jgi:putative flippase GtrA
MSRIGGFFRSPTGRKAVRYAMVSAVAVALTQALLIGFLGFGAPAIAANIVAVTAASIPAYLLNRRWVWGRDGRHDFAREVVPFWVFALIGLAMSSVLVAAVSGNPHTSPFVVSAANLSGFATLWALRFVVLDQVLFAPASTQ